MNEEFKKMARELYDFSEHQLESLSEKQQKIIKSRPLRQAHKIIMEVVKAENCALKPKVGDRYVMSVGGVLMPEESTFPLCLWALAPMLPINFVIFDRVSQGQDPNGHLLDSTKCACVLGKVTFKVYCEKA